MTRGRHARRASVARAYHQRAIAFFDEALGRA
jgi:hypothetical protein